MQQEIGINRINCDPGAGRRGAADQIVNLGKLPFPFDP